MINLARFYVSNRIRTGIKHKVGSGSGSASKGLRLTTLVCTSVADPDVLGPPRSGSGSSSTIYGSGSGSFYNQAKIVRGDWPAGWCSRRAPTARVGWGSNTRAVNTPTNINTIKTSSSKRVNKTSRDKANTTNLIKKQATKFSENKPRGRILAQNPYKSLKSFFSLLFTVTFTALSWDFYFFKLTHPLSVSTVQLMYIVKEKGGKPSRKPYPPSLWFKKSIQKPKVWELWRLWLETSTKFVRTWIQLLVEHRMMTLRKCAKNQCCGSPMVIILTYAGSRVKSGSASKCKTGHRSGSVSQWCRNSTFLKVSKCLKYQSHCTVK